MESRLMAGRPRWRGRSWPRQHWSQAITFVVGLVLAILAIGALLELRGRMMDAFATLGTLNVLQESRAKSVNTLSGAAEARPADRASVTEALDALKAGAKDQSEIDYFVTNYVRDAKAALSALSNTPIDQALASRYLNQARHSSDQLDLTFGGLISERSEALQRDISRMIIAVGALIVGVVIITLTQGWEMLGMGRRLFRTQNDSAARIASLSTTLSESREALARMNRRLTLAMQSAHVVVFSIELPGTVTWSLDAGNGVFGNVSTPFLLSELAPIVDRPQIVKQIVDASGSHEAVEFEMRVEAADNELRWVKVTLLPLDAEVEKSLLGSAVDITDIKRREEGNILLMRELSHRSKNLLAVVQAMARQTAKTTPSPAEFYERFGTRLRALAAGHDLLVKSVYVSAELEELIQSQIGALATLIGSRIFVSGPSVRLRPEATQNLGMALHELAANAQIHGAMTSPTGQIHINWSLDGNGSEGRLTIDWVESGGPPPLPATRRGFGSTLILENLPRSLHGTVTLEHSSDGARCHMEFPLNYLLEGWKSKEIGDQAGVAS